MKKCTPVSGRGSNGPTDSAADAFRGALAKTWWAAATAWWAVLFLSGMKSRSRCCSSAAMTWVTGATAVEAEAGVEVDGWAMEFWVTADMVHTLMSRSARVFPRYVTGFSRAR